MEANILRFYKRAEKKGIIRVAYEPEIFYFGSNRFNIHAYIPDLKVTSCTGLSYYIEIKGWLSKKDVKKAILFSKNYSGLKLYFIFPKQYKLIEQHYAASIPHWEY